MNSSISGWLLVDKPRGWTSFDVVNKVRGVLAREQGVKPRSIKVGHTGTLDPLATGLLVLAVGSTTKQIQAQVKADKTYKATFTLGATSDTGDAEGTLTTVSDRQPTEDELRQVIQKFTGTIEQVPPKYSALKVDGVAAYKRARRGEDFTLKPREVTIHSAALTRYEYPEADVTCAVSSGTYIRVLVEDYGHELGVGAYLSALRRTTVGAHSIDSAVSPEDITAADIHQNLQK